MNTYLELKSPASFTPILGQLRNLHTLYIHQICNSEGDEFDDMHRKLDYMHRNLDYMHRNLENMQIMEFIFQLPKLQRLQHLYLDNVHFLHDHLDYVLGKKGWRVPWYHPSKFRGSHKVHDLENICALWKQVCGKQIF